MSDRRLRRSRHGPPRGSEIPTTKPNLLVVYACVLALEGFTETLSIELEPCCTQISSVLPGGFVTEVAAKLQTILQHPAYAGAANPTAIMRKYFEEGSKDKETMKTQWSDPVKGVQKIFDLSQLEDPPLRLLLGKDAHQYVTQYLGRVTREVEQYASWSDGLRYEANLHPTTVIQLAIINLGEFDGGHEISRGRGSELGFDLSPYSRAKPSL